MELPHGYVSGGPKTDRVTATLVGPHFLVVATIMDGLLYLRENLDKKGREALLVWLQNEG